MPLEIYGRTPDDQPFVETVAETVCTLVASEGGDDPVSQTVARNAALYTLGSGSYNDPESINQIIVRADLTLHPDHEAFYMAYQKAREDT